MSHSVPFAQQLLTQSCHSLNVVHRDMTVEQNVLCVAGPTHHRCPAWTALPAWRPRQALICRRTLAMSPKMACHWWMQTPLQSSSLRSACTASLLLSPVPALLFSSQGQCVCRRQHAVPCWMRCAEIFQLRQVVKRGRSHPRAYLLPSPVGKPVDPEETFRPAVCPRSKVATPPGKLRPFNLGGHKAHAWHCTPNF